MSRQAGTFWIIVLTCAIFASFQAGVDIKQGNDYLKGRQDLLQQQWDAHHSGQECKP